eukprot:COSAG01_NODE_30030_length_624_cov_1.836190_1_plen_77_part_10
MPRLFLSRNIEDGNGRAGLEDHHLQEGSTRWSISTGRGRGAQHPEQPSAAARAGEAGPSHRGPAAAVSATKMAGRAL